MGGDPRIIGPRGGRRQAMATKPLDDAFEMTTFPSPGVATGIQRAIAAAREMPPRPADAGRLGDVRGARGIVDRTFRARRLHVFRRAALRRPAAGPSVPA
jgi:hypothetical protein